MLKHRIIFGSLMTALFAGMLILDGYLDGSLFFKPSQPQATILTIILALLAIPAQLEIAKLAQPKNMKLFAPVTIIASVILTTAWYWPGIFPSVDMGLYFSITMAFSILAVFIYQFQKFKLNGVFANCGLNIFAITYLGLLSSFILALRVQFGLWPLMMFIFTVKFSDIGAFTVGKMFGKHKFSPTISPNKTWEGMAGAVLFAVIIALSFAIPLKLMTIPAAVIFGFIFAFIGQLGDLAESMLKRDAQKKDSANKIPGFGGILDIIDSPLVAAVFGYLFFLIIRG